MKLDTVIWPKLQLLAACLCQEVIDSDLPPLDFCGVMPGAQAALECNMGWVRAVAGFHYRQFPVPFTLLACDPGMLGFTVEVGMVRCYSIPDDGSAPNAAMLAESTELQLADMAAMRRAIICCLNATSESLISGYTPIGPQGGVVGGTWQLAIPQA